MGAQPIGLKEILIAGGPTLALLILLSVYSLALIWERYRAYAKARAGLPGFLDKLRHMIRDGNLAEAVNLSRAHKGPAAGVVMASLVGPSNREERRRSTERAVARALADLERGVAQLGTIASVSPFIGLFGTVIGVMRAFKDLASAAGAGPGVVAVGISEALVCTAAGLFVAIPAVAFYNYFRHQSSRMAEELGWISEEIIETLSERAAK